MKYYTGQIKPFEIGDEPEGVIWGYCLDCNWATASYTMDKLVTETYWHEWAYDHIVHIAD